MATKTKNSSNKKSHPRSRDHFSAVHVLDKWKPQLRATSRAVRADAGTVIDMYDIIGADYWSGGGITAAWVADQIRGAGDVVININSPGGDFFEGLAIYNLLRGHVGRKTVNIIGMAASAASLIACAGDDILIGAAAYVMIHNCWGFVVGDKNDMSQAASTFAQFDSGARVIYTTRTGKPDAQIVEWMDDETWFLGQEAIDQGFATGLLAADAVIEEGAAPPADPDGDGDVDDAQARGQSVSALRRIEAALCQTMSRSEARRMLNQFKGGKPDAAARNGKPGAAEALAAADGLRGLLSKL